MEDNLTIQWFPGHMAKTRRLISESLGLVDAVAEITDARIPVSSRNPELAGIVVNKPRIVILNKCDTADEKATAQWLKIISAQGTPAIAVDSKSGKGLNRFLPLVNTVLKGKKEQYAKRGLVNKSLKIMIVGIPNVGKSSFINRMSKSGKAKVEDRPGVTRGNQWYNAGDNICMLDTPGVLWPKFDDDTVAQNLAFTGAVKDTVMDIELLAIRLLDVLKTDYPRMLAKRYNLTDNITETDSRELFEFIGKKRGMLISGGEIDAERTASMLLDEFRAGKIGNITLEKP
ncbi:MAG: ribosome biogenesis GTPase YlqF [Acutalibacteraceae bacterium]